MTIVDVGIQKQDPYQGKIKKPCQQVILGFDLVDDMDEDEKPIRMTTGNFPLNVSLDYKTKSIHYKSKLGAIVKAIDPSNKLFNMNLTNLINQPCLVTVKIVEKTGNNGEKKVYANFGGCNPVPNMKGFTVADSTNAPFIFDFDNPTLDTWTALNERLKAKCREAVNYPGSNLQAIDEIFMTSQAESAPSMGSDVPY